MAVRQLYNDLIDFFLEKIDSHKELPKAVMEFAGSKLDSGGGFCGKKISAEKIGICAWFNASEKIIHYEELPEGREVQLPEPTLIHCQEKGFFIFSSPDEIKIRGAVLPFRLLLLFHIDKEAFWGLALTEPIDEPALTEKIAFGRAVSKVVAGLMKQEAYKNYLQQEVGQQREEILTQLEQLSLQARQLNEKNNDIADSIKYAARIQSTVLQTSDGLKSSLNKSFVIYRPKDFLSGDFYLWTRLGSKLFLTVADCTGHGVPGAMLSFMGINLLNQILLENQNIDPAQILTLLNFRLVCSLQPDGPTAQKLQDGMEISLLVLDLETLNLTFAGAGTKLYHERLGILNVVNGSRFPIAGLPLPDESEDELMMRSYDNNFFSLIKGDRIYMTTDGLGDQHGVNETGKMKKIGKAQVRLMFQQARNVPFGQVEGLINNQIENQKQESEQTDDILVIGFEI